MVWMASAGSFEDERASILWEDILAEIMTVLQGKPRSLPFCGGGFISLDGGNQDAEADDNANIRAPSKNTRSSSKSSNKENVVIISDTWQARLFLMLECPTSSLAAQAWEVFILCTVMACILLLMLE